MKVLVADDLSAEGVEILKCGEGLVVDVKKVGLKPAELKAIVGEYEAIAVRSATKVTAEIMGAGKNLKVIGRGEVGVDNVQLERAAVEDPRRAAGDPPRDERAAHPAVART